MKSPPHIIKIAQAVKMHTQKRKAKQNGNILEASKKISGEKKKENNRKEIKEIMDKSISDNENNQHEKNVYILGDSMDKKLNGYVLIKKIKHKHLDKVHSF